MNLPQWFHDNGIGVFPIKFKSKEPACKSWDDYTCTREEAGAFRNYGVRLAHWLGVVDSDSTESEVWVHEHVLDTPFKVTTARGIHRYYRLPGPTPKFLHRDGLTIEFRNAGQYVLGPGCVHPSGRAYIPADWSWVLNDVPIFPADFLFDDRPGADGVVGTLDRWEFPETVSSGERHDQLYKLLRSFKALGNDREMARAVVSLANQNRCVPPLREDGEFERWFRRGWDAPDRPIVNKETTQLLVGGQPWRPKW
jgi:hypothetical protein